MLVSLPEECLRDIKPGDTLHDLYFAGMTFEGPLFVLDNPELSDAPPASAFLQPTGEPSPLHPLNPVLLLDQFLLHLVQRALPKIL